MPDSWINYPLRFRPDQIATFQELYPDKQLAPFVRMLLDDYFDGKKPAGKRLEEVRKLRDKAEKQAMLLKAEEDRLEKEEEIILANDVANIQRTKYISEKPEILIEFKKCTISSIGYRKLQRELKFTSRKQVEAYLSSLNGEVKQCPAE